MKVNQCPVSVQHAANKAKTLALFFRMNRMMELEEAEAAERDAKAYTPEGRPGASLPL